MQQSYAHSSEGVAIVASPEGIIEIRTATCGHCQRICNVLAGGDGTGEPDPDPAPGALTRRERPGTHVCHICWRIVCGRCHAKGKCTPWEEQMARMEARAHFLRSAGIACLMLIALLFSRAPLHAQVPHSAILSHGASPTLGIAGYNIYRAPCNAPLVAGLCPTPSEGTFIKLNAIPYVATTYTDSTVVAGGRYSYYETAVCPPAGCSPGITGESAASNHVGALIPSDTPLPGPNLSITTVALSFPTSTTETVKASWNDPSLTATDFYLLSNKTNTLARGVISAKYSSDSGTTSKNGTYTRTWTGSKQSDLYFLACSTTGQCDFKKRQ